MNIVSLTAVNDEQKYLDCVPLYIEFWLGLNRNGVAPSYRPHVIYVGENLPEELIPYAEWCQVFRPPKQISTVLLSQVIRLLMPALVKADLVITSDVDMLPLNDKVFARAVVDIEAGIEFVICRNVLADNQFPICYNIAAPTIWSGIFSVDSLSDVTRRSMEISNALSEITSYSGNPGGAGWYTDQEYLFEKVTEFESAGGRVSKLRDSQTGHLRLDRGSHRFPLNWIVLPLVALNFFTDYHLHHPVRKFEKFFRALRASLKIRASLQRKK